MFLEHREDLVEVKTFQRFFSSLFALDIELIRKLGTLVESTTVAHLGNLYFPIFAF